MKLLILFSLWSVATALPRNKAILENETDVVIENDFSYALIYTSEHQIAQTLNEPNQPLSTLEVISKLGDFFKAILNKTRKGIEVTSSDIIEIDEYHLVIPAGLIFLDLKLKTISAFGLGNYIVHESKLDVNERTFNIDLEFSSLLIISEEYDLQGNIYTAVPLYGKGRAEFKIDGIRFGVQLLLTQSQNAESPVVEDVKNATVIIRAMKSNLSGVVGGGAVDAIVNALIEDVILYYVNRFNGVIALYASYALVGIPITDQLKN